MGRSSGSRPSGGRSSGGFGGGRSSGGFSGGGRSSRSSFSSSSSSGSSFSSSNSSSSSDHYERREHHSYEPHYEPRPPRVVPRPTRPRPILIHAPQYNRPPRKSQPRKNNVGSIFVMVIVFIIVVVVLSSQLNSHTTDMPPVTKQREPLNGVVHKTDWYEDELGWITNERVLITGLEDFYAETGVQPYVVLLDYNSDYWMTSEIDVEKADQFLEKLYEEKFTDEGHFIFAYFSCQYDSKDEMDGEFRYLSGYAVDTIMDDEALKIFWGQFEKNYYNTSLSIEKMISNTFKDTGTYIMDRPTNAYDMLNNVIVLIVILLIIYVIYKLIKNKQQRKKEKEAYTTEILNKPLETFGTDTSDLEKKYK